MRAGRSLGTPYEQGAQEARDALGRSYFSREELEHGIRALRGAVRQSKDQAAYHQARADTAQGRLDVYQAAMDDKGELE